MLRHWSDPSHGRQFPVEHPTPVPTTPSSGRLFTSIRHSYHPQLFHSWLTTAPVSPSASSEMRAWSSRLPVIYAPVIGIYSADVTHCRHSTRLRAWSSFSPLIFQQDTRCSTDTQQFWKLCCCRTTPVEQFTCQSATDEQLRTDSSGDIWNHIYLGIFLRNHSAL